MPRRGTRDYQFGLVYKPTEVVLLEGNPELGSIRDTSKEILEETKLIRRANELIVGQEVEESE